MEKLFIKDFTKLALLTIRFILSQMLNVKYNATKALDNLISKIKERINLVSKRVGVEIDKIILFGSRARGDYKENSDWDILVITRTKIFDYKKRWALYSAILDILPTDRVDLIIIDKETFESKKEKSLFLRQIMKEGKVLWTRK